VKAAIPYRETDALLDPELRAGLEEIEADEAARGELLPAPPLAPWPEPLHPAALRGLAGEIVRAVEPHSEADPVGILVSTLVRYAATVGRSPHCMVGSTRHGVNLFALLVGSTSQGRKGTAEADAEGLFRLAGEDSLVPTTSGLGSGEGLVNAIRDEVKKTKVVREKGGSSHVEDYVAEDGVEDKRLLVREAEFAHPLRVSQREGSVLSPVIRLAFDGADLRITTRNAPLRASNPHVCILGHIPPEEERRLLADAEVESGFANRFAHFAVRRSKLLPNVRPVPRDVSVPLAARLRETVAFGRGVGEMERDAAAEALWGRLYVVLAEERPGLAGALLARAHAHVLRFSMVYALMDGSAVVRRSHLESAAALWAYSELSVRFVFGDMLRDRRAEELVTALREAGPKGLKREDVRDLFSRNLSAVRVDMLLGDLARQGLAHARKAASKGPGRPAVTWYSGPAPEVS
jgi:hypothetical protein